MTAFFSFVFTVGTENDILQHLAVKNSSTCAPPSSCLHGSRADLIITAELERILVSRLRPGTLKPLSGSAFATHSPRAPRDPVVELAAKKWAGHRGNWRRGAVKVLTWRTHQACSCIGERAGDQRGVKEMLMQRPESGLQQAAQLPSSSTPDPAAPPPTPPPLPLPAAGCPTATQPPSALPAARPQPITFTTASFAATKFGSTKMKRCSGAGSPASSGVVVPPAQRMLSRSPTTIATPELLKHKPLSLSLHSLGGPIPRQLSPNAKEFVYPGSPGPLYFDADTQPMQPRASPFQPPHTVNTHPSFDPFSSPPPAQSVGIIGSNGGISYMEKPPFVEGLGSYNLQYPSQSFQPVVLAN
ncbi:protein Tob2 [Lates japonicus]|uniref:Protein Tob2 n=1 Tax=Lates japonicus TaxID=270547 RepID=A0AAD3MVM1_LATJO|nr:protein Tob2 [Lates japonicus]